MEASGEKGVYYFAGISERKRVYYYFWLLLRKVCDGRGVRF